MVKKCVRDMASLVDGQHISTALLQYCDLLFSISLRIQLGV